MQFTKTSFRQKIMLACTLLLLFSFGMVMLRVATVQIGVKKLHWDNLWTQTVLADNMTLRQSKPTHRSDAITIDWRSLYPFTDTDGQAVEQRAPQNTLTTKLANGKKKIDRWTNENFLAYNHIVLLNNYYKNAICWNITPFTEYNAVVKLPGDNQLVEFQEKRDMTDRIQAVTEFSQYCQEHGINFVMILAPSKIARDEVYSGTVDFSNQNGDAFIAGLKHNGVAYIDLRDELIADDLNQHDMFYRTDHHWTAGSGLWATGKIANFLNDHYGYSADLSLLSATAYDTTTYYHWYLGSRGEKITEVRAALDDFTLYYPKFRTDVHIQVPTLQVDRQGAFPVMYNMKRLLASNVNGKEKPYSTDAYAAYAYGRQAACSIHNNLKPDGHRMLLIYDSFANVVRPFLALGMEDLDSIDLRQFDGSLKTYIQDTQPDTIGILYYIEELNEKPTQNPHLSLFNFQ